MPLVKETAGKLVTVPPTVEGALLSLAPLVDGDIV